MNKINKTIAVCTSVTTLLTASLSMSASAATAVNWGASNDFLSPYDMDFSATSSSVSVSSVKWSSSDIASMKAEDAAWPIPGGDYSIEFEFRPLDIATENIWSAIDGYIFSNLPSTYPELDEDDATIGCRKALNLSANTAYYGTLYLTPASGVPSLSNKKYLLEVESGEYYNLIVYQDSYPLTYAQYNRDTYFNTNYSYRSV